MKRLYLLRHAQSVSSATDDRSRVLADTGITQAKALGALMHERKFIPQLALCSPAARTTQTLELIVDILGNMKVFSPEVLYHASPGDLLTYIQTQNDDVNTILLVNHNPSIHQLAFMLTGKGEEIKIQELAIMYKPCTLTILDCPVQHWRDVMPGQNTLIDVIPPQE